MNVRRLDKEEVDTAAEVAYTAGDFLVAQGDWDRLVDCRLVHLEDSLEVAV